ncbi:hypothetical protein [Desulfonatronum lacustre]|uniref:hypothetical protein n=1 Tax=Desulfonatronum lacustre TaxID=66849 RepID=UPI00048F8E6F|nr:hypothetical protein [Desulfonatronum lacustre]SMP51961.1 hypothetical protein SAMN06295888_10796 [Desulfonatronum zhilinae]
MSAFRFVASVSVLLSILLGGLLACAPGTQPGYQPESQSGTRHVSLTADPDHADPGPFPAAFRDIVIEHIADTYPGDLVLRNIVVRPPSEGVAPVQEVNLAGFVGLVRMSLKDAERQAYVPVEYCYFLREERVLAFADAREAEWCVPE